MTNETYKKIIAELEVAFAELDAQYVEGMKKKYEDALHKVREVEHSDLRKKFVDHHGRIDYQARYAYVGGKTLYMAVWGRSIEDAIEVGRKDAESVIKSRNVKIAKKLVDADITEVTDYQFARTADGFHGVFAVETSRGTKVVRIETILAGGYNIQCLHYRTLVKIK